MTETTYTCPKCGSKMEEGFVPEIFRSGIGKMVWVEGKPERDFWTGVKVPGKKLIAISTYRCAQCGYLEFYALPDH